MTNDKVIKFLRGLALTSLPCSPVIKEQALDLLIEISPSPAMFYTIVGSTAMGSPRFNLSPVQYIIIDDFLGKGNKIAAIKEIRRATNWGLRDAKDASEDVRNFTNAKPPVFTTF